MIPRFDGAGERRGLRGALALIDPGRNGHLRIRQISESTRYASTGRNETWCKCSASSCMATEDLPTGGQLQ